MTEKKSLSQSVRDALNARQQTQQWESFIAEMLQKLELSPAERGRAEQRYRELARHLARKLGVGENDVHVVIQGSMRTQTTISPRGNQKFDLDIVVKLTGPRFNRVTHSEPFFREFGEALKGVGETAGDPKAKKRCWRLQYPGEPFYFDVTPALPNSLGITGTDLRVRDPETVWSPSNPEEFATWFCDIAGKRFPFQAPQIKRALESRAEIDPLPNSRVGLDDILRRALQLIKLHRENYYWTLSEERKEAIPISIVLVALAGRAYDHLIMTKPRAFASPIEVVLEMAELLPSCLERRNGSIWVGNPSLPSENFADRWKDDDGAREREFFSWHARLMADLEALFSEDFSKRSEQRIKNVFGQVAVDARNSVVATPGVLSGLLGVVPLAARANPTAPVRTGSKNTLA